MRVQAAGAVGGDCEELTVHLVALLRELPASEIVDFQPAAATTASRTSTAG
jgi:hypothetical protein